MADDRNIRGPRDANRINPDQDYEIEYWANEFGVSKDELKKAVRPPATCPRDPRPPHRGCSPWCALGPRRNAEPGSHDGTRINMRDAAKEVLICA